MKARPPKFCVTGFLFPHRVASRFCCSLPRCLAIARRLMRAPASGQDLIAFVRHQVDAEAYSPNPSAARRAFKRDRQHLRDEFDVRWEYDLVE